MKKQYSLFIDTTQDYCNLAIIKDNSVAFIESTLTHNNMTDLVIEHIKNFLEKNHIKLHNLLNIYLVNGPGSFTGCRVGYICAVTLAKVFNIPLLVIDSLTFQLPKLDGVSLIDAKSNKTYLCVYKNNKLVIKPCIVDNKELDLKLDKYQSLRIYKNYEKINLKMLINNHLKHFKLVNNLDKLEPLYLKEAVS